MARLCPSAEAMGIANVPASDELTAFEAAELEHLWWPVKILDADLPNYMVPIKAVTQMNSWVTERPC